MNFLSFILCAILHSKTSLAYESFDVMAYAMSHRFDAPVIKLEDVVGDERVIFLDARELEEFEISHIPNAIHVGYDDFEIHKVLLIIPADTKVIVYCSVGYRSGKIAQILQKNSVDAYNLYGGIFYWSNSKRPLEDKNANSTIQVHGYDKIWSQWITYGDVYLPKKK
jgi:rhodanese-related sulfurtransferase